MIKSWLDMWKNIFNYKGTVSRRDYWLALIMNVIFMYAAAIPYALIAKCITDNVTLVIAIFLIAVHLPVFALYSRRARSAGWSVFTTIYLTVTIPVLSGLLVGFISDCKAVGKGQGLMLKIFALSFALSFYSSILGVILYGDPVSLPIMSLSGLCLASLTLIIYGIVNWREVVAVLFGMNKE